MMCSRNATAPQLANSSMMQASSVTRPSRSGSPPSPTEVIFGSPSGIWTPASTASSALPPLPNIFHASAFAPTPKFHVETTRGLFTGLGSASAFVKGAKDARAAPDWRNFLRDVFICLVVGHRSLVMGLLVIGYWW